MSGHSRFLNSSAAALAAALLTAGCSDSRSIAGGAAPIAQAPRIEVPASLALDQDTSSGPQKIRLSDADSDTAQLVLTASSSDPALLPATRIRIDGVGADRTLTITPAEDAIGAATIVLTVRDPSGLEGTGAFDVRVNPVLASFRQLANESFSTMADGAPGKVSGVTVLPDADEDALAFDDLIAHGAQ